MSLWTGADVDSVATFLVSHTIAVLFLVWAACFIAKGLRK